MTMLTLDSTTLFLYTHIISSNNHYPSKKRKADHESISTWVDNVKPDAPASRAASSRTGTIPPPTLTAGSTRSSSNSILTNNIRITQSTQLATNGKKRKEPRIEVDDDGMFSDYEEMTGRERDRAISSPPKNGVRATSSVSNYIVFF